MKEHEIRHRSQVLCDYFKGRDWDKNDEYTLKRKLVLEKNRLLPDYPYLIEDEWEVESGQANQGRGDLVFTDGMNRFAVVEVKWIDLESTGRTSSTKRTHKRKVVKQQAIHYAHIYSERVSKQLKGVQVQAFIFTNEDEHPTQISETDG